MGSILKRTGARIVELIVNKMSKDINRGVDIGSLQERYNAKKQRVIMMFFPDVEHGCFFRVKEGRFELLPHGVKYDGKVTMTLKVLLNLIKGEIEVVKPDGSVYKEKYLPVDAFRYGDLLIEGDTYLSDFFYVLPDVYEQIFPEIKDKLEGLL